MPSCSVLGCNNHSRNKNLSKGGISYHRLPARRLNQQKTGIRKKVKDFPQDPFIKEKWVSVCGRQNWFPTKLSTICSEHFLKEDFIIKKRNKYIKRTAVPRRNILIRKYMFDGDADELEAVDVPKSTLNEQEVIVIPDDTETVLSPPQIGDTTEDHEGNFITIEIPSTQAEENNLVSNRSTQVTPRIKRLLRLLELKESKIKQQDAELKQLQEKNQQLQKNGVVLRQKLKTIDEQFSMSNNLLIQLESTDSPVNFDSTIFHVKEEPMQT